MPNIKKAINFIKPRLISLTKKRKILLFSLGILVVIIPIAILMFKKPSEVEASWWNDSWRFRKVIDITYSGSTTLTNYQIKLNQVDVVALYNQGKIQIYCEDLMFVDNSGNILDYWVEDENTTSDPNPPCNTNPIDIWVKVPYIDNPGTKIYMYYGNRMLVNTSNKSNGNATFDFFDSFSGSSVDTTKWSYSYSPLFANGLIILQDSSGEGIVSLNTFGDGSPTDNDSTILTFKARQQWSTTDTALLGYSNTSPLTSNYTADDAAYFYFDSTTGGNQEIESKNGASKTSSTVAIAESTGYDIFTISWESSTINFYMNETSNSISTNNPNSPQYVRLQNTKDNAVYVDYVFIRKYAATSPSVPDYSSYGNEEKGPGAIGYWKFDEGYGTKAYNSAGVSNSLDGSISNATWKSPEYCYSYNCLEFDGNGSVTTYDANYLDFDGSGSFTIQGWVRHKPMLYGQQAIVSKYETTDIDGGFEIYFDGSGDIKFGIDSDNTGFPADVAGSTSANYDDNQWHFFTAVKTTTSSIKLYIDGVLISTDSSLTATGDISNDDYLFFGKRSFTGSTNYYTGFLDEIKIYEYARSLEEIKTDFLSGRSSEHGLSASFNQDNKAFISNGLVGYWKLDETSGNASDSSGNGMTLTNRNNATYSNGKFNNGLIADGTARYLYIADNASLSITSDLSITAWVKPDAVVADTKYAIAGKWDYGYESYQLAQYGDEIRLLIDGTDSYVTTTSANLSIGTWYHVVGVYNAQAQQADIYVNGIKQDIVTTGTIPASIGDDVGRFQIAVQNTGGLGFYSYLIPVASGNDDAYEKADNTGFSGTATTVLVRRNNNSSIRTNGGFRFNNVQIPNSELITYAYLEATVDGAADMNSTIYAEDIDDSSDFVTNADVTGRTATTAGVSWIDTISSQPTYSQSPDITTVLQEVVDRPGWSSGSDLTILVKGNSTSGASQDAEVVSYESSYDYPVSLYFEYGSPPSGYYDGNIDDVRLYNRMLTPLEVQSLYKWAPNPVGWWKLDEGEGTSAYDSSSNNNTLTLTNSPVYVPGKFGNAIQFSGSNAHLLLSDDSDFDFTAGIGHTLEAWVKHGTATGKEIILSKYAAAGYKLYMESDGDITCGEDYDATWTPTDSVTSTAATYDDNNWHHIACVRDGSTSLTLYIDGESVGTQDTSLTNSTLANADPLYVGIDADGTSYDFVGLIDDIKIYNYARSQSQIIQDINLDHPVPGSPIGSAVAEWKLDEGYGTLTRDTGTGGNNLTLSTASWTNSGKFNRAYQGASNYRLSATDDSALDFLAADGMAVSLWFKRNTISNQEYLIYKVNSNQGYSLYMDSDGDVVFGISDNFSGLFPEDSIGGSLSGNYDDNEWHHVAAVKNGTSYIKLYLDGEEIASDSTLDVTGSLANSGTFYIADANGTDGSDEFLGQIDQINIYKEDLTADQIKVLYNQGKSAVMGALSTNSSGDADRSMDRSYCVPGDTTATCRSPIGEWLFDENSGSSKTYDSSGIGNDGTIDFAGSVVWAPSIHGSSLFYDGSQDNVSIFSYNGNSGDTEMTTMAWVKQVGIAPIVESSAKTYYIIDTGSFALNYLQGISGITGASIGYSVYLGGSSVDSSSSEAQLNNDFAHIALTWKAGGRRRLYFNGILLQDLASSSSASRITTSTYPRVGSNNTLIPSNNWMGAIDNVKIFDYQLNDEQISWNHNRGAPSFHLKFDECQGSTAYDSSGNGFTATIYPSVAGNTSVGTCDSGTSTHMWDDGTDGKYNYSLGFDGTDDYVVKTYADYFRFNEATDNFSVFAWINPTINNRDMKIVNVLDSSNDGWELRVNDDGTIACKIDSTEITSNKIISTSSWTHVGCTFDRAGNYTGYGAVYVNGVKDESGDASVTSNAMSTAANLYIGRASSSDTSTQFNGLIDDLKIYHYYLNNTQVKTLYNQESAVRFGPETGAPE